MKKFVTAIMAVLYLSITSGFVLNMHYCMNKLSSVDLQYTHDDVCGKCGMKNKDGCCKDEIKIVKLADEHKYVVAAQQLSLAVPVVKIYSVPSFSLTAQENQVITKANSPPLLTSPDIYLNNCVFRI